MLLKRECSLHWTESTEHADRPGIYIDIYFTAASCSVAEKKVQEFLELYQMLWCHQFDVNPSKLEWIQVLLHDATDCVIQLCEPNCVMMVCEKQHKHKILEIFEDSNLLNHDDRPTKTPDVDARQDKGARERSSIPETKSTNVIPAAISGHHPCGFLVHNAIEVFVHKCDITKLHVDAVVNAANEDLSHGGGVAKAISDAAGPELNREGRQIINRYGKLADSMVAVTTGGNMPCKKVIHAVGPRWPGWGDQQRQKRCLELLHNTFKNIFEETSKRGFKSLAMPAVSSGNYLLTVSNNHAIVYYLLCVFLNICLLFCKLDHTFKMSKSHLNAI
jgi:O-acetyl-ADP-ribose deacetylase (regulator of RNase III)